MADPMHPDRRGQRRIARAVLASVRGLPAFQRFAGQATPAHRKYTR